MLTIYNVKKRRKIEKLVNSSSFFEDLQSHEKIRAVFVLEAMPIEVLAGLVDLKKVIGGSEIGVELPSLAPDVVIKSAEPWVGTPFGDFELPHPTSIRRRRRKWVGDGPYSERCRMRIERANLSTPIQLRKITSIEKLLACQCRYYNSIFHLKLTPYLSLPSRDPETELLPEKGRGKGRQGGGKG